MTTNKIRLTLKKSRHGRIANHKKCLTGLGLRKIGQVVELPQTGPIMGMVRKVAYLLKIEELN